jgi:hypothetical protein
MSEDGRTLALYLLTSPHTTLIGAFRLPDGYVCEDLQWTVERVSKGFAELFEKGFANRCETTKWVWIRKFLEWNPPENPNQWKSARKLASQVPDECAWNADFQRVFARAAGDPEPAPRNPSETVCKPFRNQEQEQEQEQDITPPTPPSWGSARARATSAGADSTPVKGLDTQAWERWFSYRKQIRRPLKPASIPAAQRALAAFGVDQAAVVEQSIANGWQGLFPLKNPNGPHTHTEPAPQRAREFPA